MPTLVERADALRARNRILESVPGSGFHDNDRDAHNRLAAPHRRHEVGGMSEGSRPVPRISENVVCFLTARQGFFAGTDAARVFTALQAYHARQVLKRYRDLTGTEIKLLEEIPLLAIDCENLNDNLMVWLDTWNDYLHALDEQGIVVSCLPFVSDGVNP